jgi:adenine-specific DNA-methyltransferase
MIEGDNLEVLKLLQKSYAGKVKLIYIDPPYNTGKDFVYPDNFQDNIKNYLELTGQVEGGRKISSNTEASGRFHTDWLNMMYPRLKLAHMLLRQDGFLFATIDDAEVHHLRQAINEVFGEDNFIANVVWQKKYTRANDALFFSDNHDHILVFAKSKENSELAGQPRTEGQVAAYSNPDGHPKGPWKATPLHAKSGSNTSSYRFKNGIE